jgi:putative transposase
MGRHVLKTPVRTPLANAFCERLIGTIRRECLDWLIPIHEGHLRSILRASLGPRIPDPLSERKQLVPTGHRLPEHGRVIATPILGGLHHEYHLAQEAA